MKFLRLFIKFLLFSTALTPLIISWSTIFPFILGKTLFFRSVIEIALIFFVIYLTFKHLNFYAFKLKDLNFKTLKLKLSNLIKNPLIVFLCLFLISFILSVIFAENPYRAFWGDLERGEGLFGMLHCLAFLIMALAVFDKKDWLNYFKISLVVGLVIIFYAFLQYFDIKNFPFALMPEARPISYIGNSAFLATHMFFLMMFAVIVFFESIYGSSTSLRKLNFLKLKFWRFFSLLMIILSVATIFITATRGAILGLGAGIFVLLLYFAFKKPPINSIFGSPTSLWKSDFLKLNLRKLAIGLILIMFIFGGVFWLTRDNSFWQKIPGLNRLAKTAAFDINDASTQFRLITWKLSWNAFKERPLLGWGPENYIVAYEKYYDPEYAVYGESWLDRAHNKIFDVLIMQGIFGLLAYLGIFGAAFYLLIKSKEVQPPQINNNVQRLNLPKLARGEAANYAKPIIAALLFSYFIQNLFVFDQIISYAAFFAVLGFSLYSFKPLNFETSKPLNLETFKPLNLETFRPCLVRFVSYLIAAVLITGIGYSLYFYNLVPYIQARLFKSSPGMSHNINDVVEILKKAMYPYNFAQFNIRGSGVDTIYMDQFFYKTEYVSNPKFKPLGDLLIKGMDELAEKEPYDIRVLIREVEMLNGITRVVSEEEAAPLYQKAEKLMREAVKRAPTRQEVYYHLAFNLAGQKRYEESFEAARCAISLNPNIARAHFHLALMYAIADKINEAVKEVEITESLDPDLNTLMSGDRDTALLIYNLAGKPEKIAETIIKNLNKTLNGENGHIFERKYYEAAARYFAVQKDAENFVKAATYLSRFPDLKDDMEVLIDLAQKGMWDIMLKL